MNSVLQRARATLKARAQPFMDSHTPEFRGRLRGVPTMANRQQAVAWYLPHAPGSEYRPLSVDVLRFEDGKVAEITGFVLPDLFPAFGLPQTL